MKHVRTHNPKQWAFRCSSTWWANPGPGVFRISILGHLLFLQQDRGFGGDSVCLREKCLAHQRFLLPRANRASAVSFVPSCLFASFATFEAVLQGESKWFRSGSGVACPVCYHCCFRWRKLQLLCVVSIEQLSFKILFLRCISQGWHIASQVHSKDRDKSWVNK